MREHQLRALAKIDADLCARVAAGLGVPVPDGEPGDASPGAGEGPGAGEPDGVTRTAAISKVKDEPGPIAGRVIGVFATDDSDEEDLTELRVALDREQADLKVIAPHLGTAGSQMVERTPATARSIEFDAVVVADGLSGSALAAQPRSILEEEFRHGKAILAWGDGVEVLEACGIDTSAEGVLTDRELTLDLTEGLVRALGLHRAWGWLAQLEEAGTQAW